MKPAVFPSSTLSSFSPASLAVVAYFLVVVPAAWADRHGEITSDDCPYSCTTEGIPLSDCRDWRNGNICFVEDLRKPSSFPGVIVPRTDPSRRRERPPGARDPDLEYRRERDQLRTPELAACDQLNPNDITRPKIFIERVVPKSLRTGNKMTILGAIEGVCLVEGGYFENGERVQNFPVVSEREFNRFPFELRTDGRFKAEIRVYNSAGKSDIIEIRPNGAYKHLRQESMGDHSSDDEWGL